MKVKPLYDRLLVERTLEDAMTAGGIIIPDTAKEKPQEGRVLAVGKGRRETSGDIRPLDVRQGDRVLFSKYAGTEVQVDGKEQIIIREDDVLAVLE